MSNTSPSLPPGFRFHPTDEELILHYLYKRVASPRCPIAIIADINIYNFNPWDLPAKAMFGEREWYFFSPRDRKYPNGVRPNRSAGSGYWKATGTDKPIENIGVKKALVFYKGKPPKAMKTDWIMHEYRLADSLLCSPSKNLKPNRGSMRLDDWVLCRIYQKHRHHSPESCRPEEVTEMKNFASANKMQKTFSVSEFLIEDEEMSFLPGMLETPADVPPLSNPDPLFCFGSQTGDPESSVFLHEQSSKRQKMVEKYNFDDCGGQLNSSNKFRSSNMYDQFWNQIDLSQFLDPATCSEFPLTK